MLLYSVSLQFNEYILCVDCSPTFGKGALSTLSGLKIDLYTFGTLSFADLRGLGWGSEKDEEGE